jgi:hypothetical protein
MYYDNTTVSCQLLNLFSRYCVGIIKAGYFIYLGQIEMSDIEI